MSDDASATLEARQTLMQHIKSDTSDLVLYASIRRLVMKHKGLLWLYALTPFDKILAAAHSRPSSLGTCRTELSQLLVTIVQSIAGFSANQEAQEALRLLETTIQCHENKKVQYVPPRQLIRLDGFSGFVFPDWERPHDLFQDESVSGTGGPPVESAGLGQIELRCSIQSCFAVALCTSSFRRRMDQRTSEDLARLKPLAQITYAIQVHDWERLPPSYRVVCSNVLTAALQPSGIPYAPAKLLNVHEVFHAMFHGVASFSFSTSRLPVCDDCEEVLLISKSNSHRIVNNTEINIMRTETSCQEGVGKFFRPAATGKRSVEILDLDPDDGALPACTIQMEETASCPKCKQALKQTRVLLDRLPNYLALAFDRSTIGIGEPAVRLPTDWKMPITVKDALTLRDNILSRVPETRYTLIGGIRCDSSIVLHYTTLWKHVMYKDDSWQDIWLEYDGYTPWQGPGFTPDLQRTEEDALAKLDSHDCHSVANILVYKQQQRKSPA